jgi:carbamoyltransferase
MGKTFHNGKDDLSDTPSTRDSLLNREPNSLFPASDGQWLLWSQQRAFEGCGRHLMYLLANYFGVTRVSFRQYDHHLAHAAHACFSSPFDQALCLIADGEGEVGSASCFLYSHGRLAPLSRSWGRAARAVFMPR